MVVTESDQQAIQNATTKTFAVILMGRGNILSGDFSVLSEIRACLMEMPGLSWNKACTEFCGFQGSHKDASLLFFKVDRSFSVGFRKDRIENGDKNS